jgi:hypothetical protein
MENVIIKSIQSLNIKKINANKIWQCQPPERYTPEKKIKQNCKMEKKIKKSIQSINNNRINANKI